MTMADERQSHRGWWFWGAGYAILLAAVVWLLFAARQSALANLSTETSQSNWQAWRNDVEQQQVNPAPVQRRVPKSVEPPALVLMRDYFGVSLTGAILFSSVLYWIMAWFITGALAAPPIVNQTER
jgi:hypothetical protein